MAAMLSSNTARAPAMSCSAVWAKRVLVTASRPRATSRRMKLLPREKVYAALTMKIGVIADTHGLVRPEVGRVFAGVDHIVHAGDAGGAHVLQALRAIAPLTFVGGNNDDGS